MVIITVGLGHVHLTWPRSDSLICLMRTQIILKGIFIAVLVYVNYYFYIKDIYSFLWGWNVNRWIIQEFLNQPEVWSLYIIRDVEDLMSIRLYQLVFSPNILFIIFIEKLSFAW